MVDKDFKFWIHNRPDNLDISTQIREIANEAGINTYNNYKFDSYSNVYIFKNGQFRHIGKEHIIDNIKELSFEEFRELFDSTYIKTNEIINTFKIY